MSETDIAVEGMKSTITRNGWKWAESEKRNGETLVSIFREAAEDGTMKTFAFNPRRKAWYEAASFTKHG